MRCEGAPALFAPGRVPSDDECLDWLWRCRCSANGRDAQCPQCRRLRRHHRIRSRRSYACDHCGHQLFPTAGTLFGHSSTPLSVWLQIACLLMGQSDEVSAREIQRRFDIEYRTALRIKHRLLDALADARAEGLADRRRRPALLAGRRRLARAPVRPAPPRADERHLRGGLSRLRAAGFRRHAHRRHRRGVRRDQRRGPLLLRPKDELLRAALAWTQERGAQRLRELMSRERDPQRRLEGLLELALPTSDEIRDEYLLWLDAWARARGGRRFDDDEVFSNWHQTVVEVVRQGQAAGVFALAHSPEDFGDAFVALADGLSFKVIEQYEEMPLSRARDLLSQWVFDQLGSPPGASPPETPPRFDCRCGQPRPRRTTASSRSTLSASELRAARVGLGEDLAHAVPRRVELVAPLGAPALDAQARGDPRQVDLARAQPPRGLLLAQIASCEAHALDRVAHDGLASHLRARHRAVRSSRRSRRRSRSAAGS